MVKENYQAHGLPDTDLSGQYVSKRSFQRLNHAVSLLTKLRRRRKEGYIFEYILTRNHGNSSLCFRSPSKTLVVLLSARSKTQFFENYNFWIHRNTKQI